MRWVAAAAVVMACAPRAAEPLPPVRPQARPAEPAIPLRIENEVRASRPDLPDIAALLPDLTDQLRWPLTVMEHPALEPRYPIARELAVSGITWTELCDRGVQNRTDPSHKDELAYLSAWCAAERHDTAVAVRTLAPLRHSNNLGIANAVPFDLVCILVADVDYGHADRLLTDEHLRDPELWDLLAAAYFEVGKNADSYQASATAVQLDAGARMEVRCHRLTRLAMLGSEGQRSVFVDQLAEAAQQKVPDPTCADLALRVPCAAMPGERCEPYLKSLHQLPWHAQLLGVYENWPEVAGSSRWLDYAWSARKTWPADGSVELTDAALEAAVAAANCDKSALQDLMNSADAIAQGVKALEPRAEWVRTMLVDQRACADFHDHWVASHP